jgi:hypothetical protein
VRGVVEIVRDLVRDLVGILFPGGLLVVLTLWLLFGIFVVFIPLTSFNILTIGGNTVGFVVLLIFSYVAGQSLRLRRLDDLESACTQEYRKKHKPELSDAEFEGSIKEIDQEEENYYEGRSTMEVLIDIYEKHNNRFGLWEAFPYPYLLKGRRLARHPKDVNLFFEKFDRQGITKYKRFFNFCKTIIFEYSPSLKEELLRQESLVRLFAGIFYVAKYGKIISIVMGFLHLFRLFSASWFQIPILPYDDLELSFGLVVISIFAFVAFSYLNRDILERLRLMRVKELSMAFDGLFLICIRHKLDLG